PDRLRDQRQYAPVLEPGQRQDEDRLRAAGRQPGELRRRHRRDRAQSTEGVRRRSFIGCAVLGALAAPRMVGAQARKVARIGVLSPFSPSDGPAPSFQVFRDPLRELGRVEGEHVAFEYRWAGGKYDRLPALAAELVQSKVDVILSAWSTPSALAA